jgi:hypothetical protein
VGSSVASNQAYAHGDTSYYHDDDYSHGGYAPAVAYSQPAPVVYGPPPQVVTYAPPPQVVYVQPAPVYVAGPAYYPAPVVIHAGYYRPHYVVYGHPGWHRGWGYGYGHY